MSKKQYDVIILSGGFDPPHIGHIRMILKATELADTVVVGCNSDDWLERKKGYKVMIHSDREELIRAIKGIEDKNVIAFDDSDDTAVDLIRKVVSLYDPKRVKIAFGNGGDRKEGNTPEQDYCNLNGIDTIWALGGEKIRSSSKLVEKK